MNEFERISLKQETNILETVKCMKETNPQLIPNYVRIKSIYIGAVTSDFQQCGIFT